MTFTIEIDASEEQVLTQAAAARGVALDTYLLTAAREMAALDAAEDAEDLADARRVLAKSDPAKRRTLSEMRDALKTKAQGQAQ